MLVDRKSDLASRIHTTGIFVRKSLEDFDIPQDCLGPVVRTVRLISPAGRAMTIESPRDEFRVGKMGRLYRRMLGDFQRAGGRTVLGARYLSCAAMSGGVPGSRVRVEIDREQVEIEARLVIGADGARSRVAADLGLDQNSRWIVGVEDVVHAGMQGPARFDCHLDPRLAPGYLAWVVSDGEETHLGVGGYASRFNPVAAMEAFRAKIAWSATARQGCDVAERRGGLIPVNGVLRRIGCPRGLLIGDASGAVSPLTAGGLDPAMRLSTLAAEVAAEMVVGNFAALERYRGEAFASRFISRRWMRAALDAVSRPLVMEAACAALRTWPGRAVARHVFFGRGSFPDVQVPADVAGARTARASTAR